MLSSKTVKILAVYLSPFRPVFTSDLSVCLGGGLPTLMTGDLNENYVDYKSRLITTRGRLLNNFADKNSYLIHGSSIHTTVPYTSYATPEVPDIFITKNGHSFISDHVLNTEFRPFTYINLHALSTILP